MLPPEALDDFRENLYGPMALKLHRKSPPETGIGPWMALANEVGKPARLLNHPNTNINRLPRKGVRKRARNYWIL